MFSTQAADRKHVCVCAHPSTSDYHEWPLLESGWPRAHTYTKIISSPSLLPPTLCCLSQHISTPFIFLHFPVFFSLPFPFQSVSSRPVKRLLFHNISRTHTHILCSNLRLCPRSPPRRRGSVVMRVLLWRHWNKWAVSLSGTLVAGRGGDSRRNFTLLLR